MKKPSRLKAILFVNLFVLVLACVSLGQEDRRAYAEKLHADAEGLFGKNTPEDREKAFPMFVEAAEIWTELGDDEKLIMALNKLNDISYYRSDLKQCIEYSFQILPLAQKIGNRNLEGGVLGNLGLYHHFLGESRKGLEFLNQSAEILGEIGEIQRHSVTLSNIGQVSYYLGDIEGSVKVFREALEMKRTTGDRKGEGIILNNLGFVFNESGEKRKALGYYEKALAIARETEDRQTEGTLLNNIGFIYDDWSEFQKAYDHYMQSYELRRKIGDLFGQAVTMQNIAGLYRTLGDHGTAVTFLGQALAIYQKGGFKREEARALSSMGSLYFLAGDKKKALEFDNKALELQKTLDNKSGMAFTLQNLAKIYLDEKDHETALGYFEEAMKYSEAAKDAADIARNHIGIARANEGLDRYDKAEEHFERALKLLKEMQMSIETTNALYFYARFEEGRNRRDSAFEKISEVIRIVEDLRSTISHQNWQAGFFAEQQKFYDFYISLLAAQHRRFPDKGFGEMALEASERARARSMLDTLGEMRSDIRGAVSSDLLEQESILRSTINAKDRQRVEALRTGKKERAAEIELDLTGHLRDYEEIQSKIRQASPGFALLNRPEPLDLATIRSEVLDEDSVLLEYFIGEERSFLFFVSKDDFEIVELPGRESIEGVSRSLIESIKARAHGQTGETASQRAARLRRADQQVNDGLLDLGRKLISPVAEKIDGKRLLIVPSGVLQYLPFASLQVPVSQPVTKNAAVRRSPRATTAPRGRTPFLIETNEIVYLPSASVVPLLRKNRSRDASAGSLIAIMADPVFDSEDPRLNSVTRGEMETAVMRNPMVLPPNLRSELSRLRFSRIEAEAISELATRDQRFVALDFAANVDEVTGPNVRNARVVHLATHGAVNSQFPALSSLVFSMVDEEGKERDGHLRLHDVFNLRLEADLVVLSACETALGKEVRGEGVVGLTRGFMYAGAPTVVASLWRVEDRATADLMKRFYQMMFREDMRPAAALRQAQISMLRERNTAQPFYWAGFTLQGDWK